MKKEEKIEQIIEEWEIFKTIYLLVIFFVGVIMFLANSTENSDYLFLLFILDILLKLFMAYHVAKYAYIFSGKKSDILIGVLGFVWVGFIGPFIAYFVVKKIKNDHIKKVH